MLLSFIGQAVGGAGSGLASTANLAIISSFSSQEREKFFGYLEAANGIGLLIGPILGAFLYGIGGFALPFLFFAVVQVISFPFFTKAFVKAHNETQRLLELEVQPGDLPSSPHPRMQEIELKKFLVKPRFIFGLLCQFFLLMSL